MDVDISKLVAGIKELNSPQTGTKTCTFSGEVWREEVEEAAYRKWDIRHSSKQGSAYLVIFPRARSEGLIENQRGDFPRSKSRSSELAYDLAKCIPWRWICPKLSCWKTYENVWNWNSERIILETATCENWFWSVLNEREEKFRHLRARVIGEGRNQKHQDRDVEMDCTRCTTEWEWRKPSGSTSAQALQSKEEKDNLGMK